MQLHHDLPGFHGLSLSLLSMSFPGFQEDEARVVTWLGGVVSVPVCALVSRMLVTLS